MGRDQTGFTLLESLTVLLISSIMLILLFDKLPSAYDVRIVKHFAEQLEDDLLYAQQAALAQNKKINVLFDAEHCKYTIKPADESLTPYLVREYDHKIAIKKSTLRQHFTYSPNGAPSQGGKMLIEANRTSFELTIYLGSGKINVQKNRGFLTIETVSAFSIWVMIAALMIPVYHQLELKAEMTKKEEAGYRILDEKISGYMLTGRYKPAETVFYQGAAYFIEWEEKGEEYEVCISVEDRHDRQHCLAILKTKGLYPS